MSRLSEEPMTKARQFLNSMVEKAQVEYDNKIIEGKEFEATSGIAGMNRKIGGAKKRRQGENNAYVNQYYVDFADMTIKQRILKF